MIVEETAEFDQFTDTHNPAAWRMFWGKVRLLLPFWGFIAFCTVEPFILTAWIFSRPLSDFTLPLLILIGLTSLPFALAARSAFRRGPSRQQVEISAAGIKSLDANHPVIPWERVGRLTLNGMPGAPGICIFSMGYVRLPGTTFWTRPLPGTGKTPPRKRQARDLLWLRQALSHPEQTQTLRTGIATLRASNPLIPELRRPRGTSIAALWLTVLALYLFMHGIPLLGLGLVKHPHPAHPVEVVTPGRPDKMVTAVGPWLVRHFHSERQLQTFFLATGASLTLASIGIYTVAVWISRRQRAAAAQSDAADAKPAWL